MRNKILHKSLTAVEMLKQVSTKTILTCLAFGTLMSFGYTAHTESNTNNPPPIVETFSATSPITQVVAVGGAGGTVNISFNLPGGIEDVLVSGTLDAFLDGDLQNANELITISGPGLTAVTSNVPGGNTAATCNGLFALFPGAPLALTDSALECMADPVTLTFTVSASATVSCADVQLILNLEYETCLLYTSPSPRDRQKSRMPSSA